MLENHANYRNIDLHLGITDCQIYHGDLIGSKSQTELDSLHQLHACDRSEDDQDKSWECTKVLKYCEEIGMNISTNHKCLVEWNDINKSKERNDINKSKSWDDFFALSLSNRTPANSFARNQNLLNRMPFCHLIRCCKSRTPMEITRVHKAPSSPTGHDLCG
jgi:hypothetical protein